MKCRRSFRLSMSRRLRWGQTASGEKAEGRTMSEKSMWYRAPRTVRRLLVFLLVAGVAAIWWHAHVLDANDRNPGSFPRAGAVVWVTFTIWFFATWPKKPRKK